MELRDRVALVTGGARRVGRAIALRLARAGCHVAVHYRSSDAAARETVREIEALGVRASGVAADLGDTDAAAQLVPRVIAELGRLDVLVNNASVFERMDIDAFNLADWERTLRVNLTAPMVLADAAADELRRRGGRIVNLCDVSTGHPWPGHLAYMVSKGGLDLLTRVLARALAPEVNVVGVAPGVAAWPDDYDAETRARLARRIPLKRAGACEDIAAAVHYLLRDGDYVTGTILPVDGGRHLA
jgi:pteridine reductase